MLQKDFSFDAFVYYFAKLNNLEIKDQKYLTERDCMVIHIGKKELCQNYY